MSTTTNSIGPYTLERELGRGAFGVVHLGHHEDRPGDRLAIKTVTIQGDADRALLEPALLAKLKHPGIVGLDDYFVADGKLVLALEYVPGEDLKALLDRGETFTPEQVRDFLVQMASALSEAHSHQIVHRDIKPSNVLVDTSQGRKRYVLTDFGVGREADGVQSSKNVGGTYLYMAPEQLRGRPGSQSDLWALGVVAYQMLTGKLPFPGPTLNDLSKQIQYGDATPPSDVTGKPVPADLESVVLGLLTKSLTERIASARDLLFVLGATGKGSTKPTAKSTVHADIPLSKKLELDERRTRLKLIVAVALFFFPNGWLSSLILVLAAFLFYRAQAMPGTSGRRRRRTVAAVFAFLAYFAVTQLSAVLAPGGNQIAFPTKPGQVTNIERPWWNYTLASEALSASASYLAPLLNAEPKNVMGVTGVMISFGTLALMVFICGQYANLRRIRRERLLLSAALSGRSGSVEFLTEMRDMVNSRFADVGFHLRYAELLYGRGDHRAAAVEARLILLHDPYHFNANLLLANSYYALGLYADCRDICDAYLAVTGYCFEFQELHTQCEGRAVRA